MEKSLRPAELLSAGHLDMCSRLLLFLLLLFFPLSGQASAESGSFLRAEDRQVAAIAYRLALNGAPLCGETYPLTGLYLHHLPEYDASDQREVVRLYSLRRGPGVLTVLDGSPAAAAGVRAGDVLVAVNGQSLPLPPDRRSRNWRQQIEAAEAVVENQLNLGAARLRLLREGREVEATLSPIQGCPGRVRLARSNQVNAFASGRTVVMTTALLGFTRTEDELAVVIAHELAHNILNHPDRLRAQKVPRGLMRGMGRNASRVRATEEEADRLGIGLLSKAGYNVNAAIPFWRRFYAKYDTMPQLFRTHPSLKARERLIREAIAGLGAAASNP